MTSVARIRIIAHGDKLEVDEFAAALDEQCVLAGLERDDIEVVPTLAAGEARELAREAARLQVERVIAAGGEGTINEVLAGLFADAGPRGARPTLGVLPLGTANDFATAAGIPAELGPSIALALTGAPRQVDVARCGGRPYLNMTSGGTLSELSASANPELKRVLGGLSYAIVGLLGLPTLEPVEFELRGPDWQWSGRAWALAVGNARMAGGRFALCPDAVIADGLLDVSVIPEELGLDEGLRLIEQRSVAEIAGVRRFRGPWLELRAPEALHINIDGEPSTATAVDFGVEPGALAVVLPPACPLLEARTPDEGPEAPPHIPPVAS